MRLLGRSTSGNVQKVMLLLEELGLEHTREDYGRQFGNTGDESYLSLNPTGKVPTLVDGDLAIWESNTILRYIAAKANSPLYPTDLAQRSQVERWMDWLLASVMEAYMTGFKASRANETVDEATVKTLADTMTMLERQLAKSAWVAGEQMSVADIALAPIVNRILNFPIALPDLPHLKAWQAKWAERPSFQKVVS